MNEDFSCFYALCPCGRFETQVPGTQVLRVRCQVPDFRSAGSRCQVHTWCQVSGARTLVPSGRWQVPDSSCQGPGKLKMNFWLEIKVTQNIIKNHRRYSISHTANFSAITSHICEKAIKLKEFWKYLFLIFKNMEWWLIDLGKF